MQAFLHRDLRVSGTTLRDVRLGCGYTLTPDAAWVIMQLAHESHIDRLAERVARLRGIPPAEAAVAVYSTCGQLGQLGGLCIEWEASFGRLAALVASAKWRRRELVTLRGFARSMFRAYGLLCAVLVGLFVYGRLIAPDALSWWLLAAPIGVFASCVVHEAGHVLAARQARVAAVLLSSVGYMALLYRRPASRLMQRIALAGPLLAAVVCLGAAVLAPPLIQLLLLGLAMTHGLCLLPVCADGKALWKSCQ